MKLHTFGFISSMRMSNCSYHKYGTHRSANKSETEIRPFLYFHIFLKINNYEDLIYATLFPGVNLIYENVEQFGS